MKKITSLAISIILIFTIIPTFGFNATAANQVTTFTPRTTIPTSSDYYMMDINWSNNCARYACARISEILNVHIRDAYGIACGSGYHGANQNAAPITIFNTMKKHFPSGSTPKPGAIACSYTAGGYTHIAIVESVNYSAGTMCITEGCSYSNTTGAAINGQGIQNGKSITGHDTLTYSSSGNGTWFCYKQVSFNTSTGTPKSGFGGAFQGYVYLYNGTEQPSTPIPSFVDIPEGCYSLVNAYGGSKSVMSVAGAVNANGTLFIGWEHDSGYDQWTEIKKNNRRLQAYTRKFRWQSC